MECLPQGYVECLDGYNSVNVDAIDLQFENTHENELKPQWKMTEIGQSFSSLN